MTDMDPNLVNILQTMQEEIRNVATVSGPRSKSVSVVSYHGLCGGLPQFYVESICEIVYEGYCPTVPCVDEELTDGYAYLEAGFDSYYAKNASYTDHTSWFGRGNGDGYNKVPYTKAGTWYQEHFRVVNHHRWVEIHGCEARLGVDSGFRWRSLESLRQEYLDSYPIGSITTFEEYLRYEGYDGMSATDITEAIKEFPDGCYI